MGEEGGGGRGKNGEKERYEENRKIDRWTDRLIDISTGRETEMVSYMDKWIKR